MSEEIKTIEQMTSELSSIGFFIGGLSDDGIIHYYNKMVTLGKI